MMPIFLPIFIVAVQSATAAEPTPKAKESKNERTHNHSHDEEHENEPKKGAPAAKADEHDHDEEAEGHDHGGEEKHAHGEGDDHGDEEGNASVGPDKGIVEANDKDGFKLSGEAFKNFDLEFANVSGNGPFALPQSAIVLAGEESNLFRMRNNFFKRIDFKTVRKTDREVIVTSSDLAPGDKIVVAGLGFLRIAELAAFGGVAHGHSH